MPLYAEERQQSMARLVCERGRLSVASLADEYAVTTETVRRDLSALERIGLLRRVHGGAVPPLSVAVIEAALQDRDRTRTAEKDRIARAALQLLPGDGGTVLLDAGSTTSRLAALLPAEHRLTAFTNSVSVAGRLVTQRQIELHLLPGRVRPTTEAAVGADTVEALARIRADVAFLGTNGVSPTHGLSTPDRDEAATKRAILASGRRVVALCDSSKIGVESAIAFAALGEVDVLVTDSGVDPDHERRLRQAGLEVVVA